MQAGVCLGNELKGAASYESYAYMYESYESYKLVPKRNRTVRNIFKTEVPLFHNSHEAKAEVMRAVREELNEIKPNTGCSCGSIELKGAGRSTCACVCVHACGIELRPSLPLRKKTSGAYRERKIDTKGKREREREGGDRDRDESVKAEQRTWYP